MATAVPMPGFPCNASLLVSKPVLSKEKIDKIRTEIRMTTNYGIFTHKQRRSVSSFLFGCIQTQKSEQIVEFVREHVINKTFHSDALFHVAKAFTIAEHYDESFAVTERISLKSHRTAAQWFLFNTLVLTEKKPHLAVTYYYKFNGAQSPRPEAP
jgi:hypothetical protein